MMQHRLSHFHFAEDAKCPDLTMMNSRQISNVFFDMMKQSIRPPEFATNGLTIVCMFSGVNVFGSFKQSIGF
jgi:hypothetical protein